MEFASKGLGVTGTTLGAVALGTSLLNGGLGNLLGGWGNNNCCSENTPVTRYELGLQQSNSEKDAKIALLEADKYTDQKLSDVFAVLDGRIREMQKEQTKINMDQAVYNGVNTATIGCIRGQVDELLALTQRKVGNDSVCPGWGTVTITPAAAATTGA